MVYTYIDSQICYADSYFASDFFSAGVTKLDECYFSAQRDRQNLESSLVIPELKKYFPVGKHLPKRTRLG